MCSAAWHRSRRRFKSLQETDLFEMLVLVKASRSEGRDLLAEMVAELDQEIIELRSRLE